MVCVCVCVCEMLEYSDWVGRVWPSVDGILQTEDLVIVCVCVCGCVCVSVLLENCNWM